MILVKRSAAALMAAAILTGLSAAPSAHAQTIKAVMHSDVKILDPIWTTAYIQRNFGYMVWDTLFAMDEKFDVKPEVIRPEANGDAYEVNHSSETAKQPSEARIL